MCHEPTGESMRFLWVTLALLATALSGCSDDGDKPVDPALDCDGIFADGMCSPHIEPKIVVMDLPESFGAYSTVSFTWSLDNGTRGTDSVPVHSMDSRILVSNEAGTVSNMTGPDDWGMEVAREQHQNLPGTFEGSISWDAVETIYLRGYMLIDGVNTWTDLGTVDVTAPEPTGQVVLVTVGGPPAALDNSAAGMTVGDGFQIKNDQAYDYTAVFTCSNEVTVAELAVPASGSSDVVVFEKPTNCDYTMQPSLLAGNATPLDLEGKVNVNRP